MWKIIQYEQNYEVSDEGQIRNLETKQIKSLRYSSKGYARVTLYPSGKTYTIHRLVAEAFIANTENLPVINHIDGNKRNNSVDNLEWCTPKYNRFHAVNIIKTMNNAEWEGIKNPGSRLDYGLVYSIKYGILNTIDNIKLSKMLGVQEETIRRIKVNKLWSDVKEIK